MYIRAAAVQEMACSPFSGDFFLPSVMWYILIARRPLQMGKAD